jgi:glycerol uptake facilitator-like aquaporin
LGRLPGRDLVFYVIAQCLGAAAAAATHHHILGDVGSGGATVPAVPVVAAFLVEVILSFALMLVILAVSDGDRVTPAGAALGIGLTVGFCALMGGPLTGASMNPARSLGPALAAGLWRSHWVYWLAPASGMLLAARVSSLLTAGRQPSQSDR